MISSGDGYEADLHVVGDRGYVFQTESAAGVIPHIHDLLAENNSETGPYELPFDPDYERYFAIERGGMLAFMTIRLGLEVVGYAAFFIDESLMHRGHRTATQSLNYVSEKHRGIGLAFMRFCDDILKKQGINSVWRQATAKLDVGKIYERMGYELVEKSYVRSL